MKRHKLLGERQCRTTGETKRKRMAGKIGKTVGESQPYWPAAPKRPKGAPNILVVLFDDVGFSDFGCYGSPIATPPIDAIPGRGPRSTRLPPPAVWLPPPGA